VTARRSRRRVSSALGVYVVLLISLQIFLISVAVDALHANDESLAWTAAGISVLFTAGAVLFARALGGGPAR